MWHENIQAYEIFNECSTQWRIGSMGGLQGIPFTEIESIMRIFNVEDKKKALIDINVIVRSVIRESNGK